MIAEPSPAIEISTVSVSSLYANVLPTPIKLILVIGPVLTIFPDELIPILNPPVAVKIPLIL